MWYRSVKYEGDKVIAVTSWFIVIPEKFSGVCGERGRVGDVEQVFHYSKPPVARLILNYLLVLNPTTLH